MGGVAVVRFEADDDLHIIAVVENDRPVGLVTRQKLLQHFSHKFGRELWDRRPISQLMNADPRIIAAGTSMEDICREMAGISPLALLEGVVFVDENGCYAGVASVFDLYQASVNVTAAKNKALMDVTGQLVAETEKANNASRAKTDFLATMSHEIRTPLNGILGMAQALAHEKLAPEHDEKIQLIISSRETLTTLLNDVLDLSKIEAGRLDISPVDADLRATIERARGLFDTIALEKHVALTVGVDASVPARLSYDPVRIHQCLTNLISNAVKFTPTGKIEIVCSLASSHPGGSHRVSVEVRDTGIGMSPETMTNLFSAFTQADGSITRKFGGTGLGLAITRRLARLMNGDVTATSMAGAGSTFSLSFEAGSAAMQIEPPRRPAAGAQPLQGDAKPTLNRPLRVLLVDDNAVNRQVVRLFLASLHAEIVEAVNGVEALEKLEIESFDLVLLDVHMPVMDGCEVIGHIRTSRQPWRDLPVIALTADAMEGDRERFVAMGMTDYLAKPIDRRLLLNKVHEATARAAVEAQPDETLHGACLKDFDASDILLAINASAA